MLKISRLKVQSLRPLSMTLQRAECVAVQGPSGSGKSLLLRAIADLDPVSGEIFLDGASQQSMSGCQWRTKVRYFAAETGWWLETPRPHFPVNCRFEPVVEALGLDLKLLDRQIERLSTGERQRLGFARGLCDDPAVLLLDEPTAALDEEAERRVEEIILARLDEGAIVLIVTHRKEQAARLAHRRLTIEDGEAHMLEGA